MAWSLLRRIFNVPVAAPWKYSSSKAAKNNSRRRAFFEPLEERRMMATLSESGSTLTITLDSTNEFLSLSSATSSYGLSSNVPFIDGGLTAGHVTGFGTNAASITSAGLSAYDTVHIVDAAGIQGTRVTLAGGVFSDNISVSLDDDLNGASGEQSVVFAGSSSFGAASLNVFTTRNIVVSSTGATVTTSTGGITLQANTAGTATGSFSGIQLTNAIFSSSAGGDISFEATGAFIHGIHLNNADIISTSTGNISLVGRGAGTGGGGIVMLGGSQVVGGLTGSSVYADGTGGGSGGGVSLDGAPVTGAGTSIGSNGGDVEVVGQGGPTGGKGVRLWLSTISAGGLGSVTINGTGGAAASATHPGVELDTAPASIYSFGGNVSVTGQGGGRGQSHGVAVLAGTVITAGGMGTVTIDGTGGPQIGGNNGVRVAGTITSSGGSVEVTGQGGSEPGAGANNEGVRVEGTGIITAGGNATVTVNGAGGTSTGGLNAGVFVNGTITSASGNVEVNGQGGVHTGTGDRNHGVSVSGSLAVIMAGEDGTVTVNGVGGAVNASSNYGVAVSGGRITSSGANVLVSGIGGGTAQAASLANYGVSVRTGGTITAGDLGTVEVIGQGGMGNGGSNWGIELQGTDAKITSGGGPVTVSGTGGSGTSGSNGGVILSGSAIITAGGTGTVEVNGQAGATGNDNVGIWVVGSQSFNDINAKITSGGGDVHLVGQGGGSATASSRNVGIKVSHAGKVLAGASGTVTLDGTGGPGTAASYGVSVESRFTLVSSGGGDVSIVGQGGGSGASSGNNIGVNVLNGGTVSSGTGGDVTIVGTGGVGGIGNSGVVVSLNDFAPGKISSGGGNVNVTGVATGSGANERSFGVWVWAGGEITASGAGSIMVEGTGGPGTGNENQGVRVEGGTIGLFGGPVHVIGHAGNGTGNIIAGVMVKNGRIGGGTGMATVIEGTGGASANSNAYGVWLEGASTQIGATGGSIQVTGQGGGSSTATFGIGVNVSDGARLLTNSTHPITVQGTGGGGGGGASGVRLDDSGTNIFTTGGHVTITGQAAPGTAAASYSRGIEVGPAANITAGGNITLTATGGGGSGVENYGYYADGFVTSNSGNVSLTAAGGPGAFAIKLRTWGNLTATLGSVTMAGDSMDFVENSSIRANGTATFKPKSTDGSVGVRLGGADLPGMLGLTQDEIRLRVSGSNWAFGHATAGPIDVVTPGASSSQGDFWSHNNTNVYLYSGANINLNASIRTFGGSLILSPGAGSAVRPTGQVLDAIISPAGAALGSLAFAANANVRFNIAGLTANTQYDQLNIEGPINLTGANLVLTGSHTPAVGQTFRIVNNDGVDPIVGVFNGFPEGAEVPNLFGSGLNAAITYIGGTGNDVVLTVVVDADGVPQNVEDGAPNGGDGNGDGYDDSTQDNVTSLPSAAPGAAYITLESELGTLANVQVDATPPPGLPVGAEAPLGLLEFAIQGLAPGATNEVVLYVPSGVTVSEVWKYGASGWYEFDWNGTTGAQFDDRNEDGTLDIVLTFIDGQRGDDDGLVNGVIVDPVVPVFVPPPTLDSITYFNEEAASERTFSPTSSGQRSLIKRIEVVFDGQVQLNETQVDAGFIVTALSTMASVPVDLESSNYNSTSGKTTVVLKILNSASSDSAGLKDGNYRLTVNGAALGVDADNDGELGGVDVDEFFRFFGDTDGDRDVDALDFNRFRQANARTTSGDILDLLFDYDDDGQTDLDTDYNQFRLRNGKKLAPSVLTV